MEYSRVPRTIRRRASPVHAAASRSSRSSGRAVRAAAAEEKQRYRGWQDFRIWWLLFVGIILAIYAFFLWFRFQHPVKMLPW